MEAPTSWQKSCPVCGKTIDRLTAICPHCRADVRERCEACGLPYAGEPPCCGLGDECRRGKGQLTWDEGKACTPRRGRGTGLYAAQLAALTGRIIV